MLVDHADAGGDRRLAAVDDDRLAVDADLAGIGLVEAVKDRHQRRLAGAVLADDAVDRSLLDLEIDAAVGVDRAEALVDADELDGEWRVRHSRRYRGSRERAGRVASAGAFVSEPVHETGQVLSVV